MVNSTVLIHSCNGALNQKWKFSDNHLRSTNYDMCLQSAGTNITAAKCNPEASSQKFESKLLYTIDRYCTLLQRSDITWTLATNGYFLLHDLCLAYDNIQSTRFNHCEKINSQMWEFINNGQLINRHYDVCVGVEWNNIGMELNTIVVKKCDSNLRGQRWSCVKM